MAEYVPLPCECCVARSHKGGTSADHGTLGSLQDARISPYGSKVRKYGVCRDTQGLFWFWVGP